MYGRRGRDRGFNPGLNTGYRCGVFPTDNDWPPDYRTRDEWGQNDEFEPHHYINQYGHYRVRMEIPLFHGQQHIEEVLDWFYDIERFFDVMQIQEK